MRARPFHTKDIQQVMSILRLFRSDRLAPEYMRDANEHTVLVERIILTHYAEHSFVVEDNGAIIGILLSGIGCMPLVPDAKLIEECVFYVCEEYRGTKAGALLFMRWIKHAKKIKEDGAVDAIIMHTMADSKIDMEHHGFSLMQQTYIMED